MSDMQCFGETQSQQICGSANRRAQAGKADNGLPARPIRPVLKEKTGSQGQAGASQCSASHAKRFPYSKLVILRLIDWLEKE